MAPTTTHYIVIQSDLEEKRLININILVVSENLFIMVSIIIISLSVNFKLSCQVDNARCGLHSSLTVRGLCLLPSHYSHCMYHYGNSNLAGLCCLHELHALSSFY